MKKRILGFIILASITMGGCQSSSDNFLSFESSEEQKGRSIDYNISQSEYFAEDLAIIAENKDIGDDIALSSGATLLINNTEQKALYADQIYKKLYPASLTKLLTALVVLRYGELTDSVTISYNASHISEIGAKLCGFEEGDVISMEALLSSLLIYSGNDAAIAAAEHVGGSVDSFVVKMNEEANRIGAVHSNFINPNGLHDDSQYTTAYDIYLIFHELIKYDAFRSIISSSSYKAEYVDVFGTAKQKTFTNTNSFLNGDEEPVASLQILGGKTGTTSKAGNCLVLLSKDKAGTEYIAIIMKAPGSDELYAQMSHLLSLTISE